MTATKTIANPEGGNKGFILAIVAIVVIGVGLVAFLAAGRDSQLTDQSGDISVDGDSLPEFTEPGVSPPTDSALGLTAPTLTGETFEGESLTIGNDGRPKAVYFLAHWCEHCQAEVPKVQALIDDGQVPEGLDIYAISTALDASRGNFPPEAWLEREGWTVPTMKDDNLSSGLRAGGGSSFPYVLYLDSDHNVVARSSGELPDATLLELWQRAVDGESLAQ